jgi:delta 1-pyrroline-5-carboxylate dehydrogenase
MNRTTTVVVALIAAAGLSTMAYTVPEQRALAWGGFGGFGGFGGCGFGCGGPFFVHKVIIQTTSQTNNCHTSEAASSQPTLGAASALKNTTSNSEDQSDIAMQPQTQNDNHVVCLNTAVNNAGHSLGANGVASDNLGQSDVPDNLLR